MSTTLATFRSKLYHLSDWLNQRFVCITLNGANEVIQKRIVTIGLLDRCLVHPRDVFVDVISDRAASVIFAHNHPSGNLAPSVEDLKTQDQLVQAAEILGFEC